jgi:hypothetical protein
MPLKAAVCKPILRGKRRENPKMRRRFRGGAEKFPKSADLSKKGMEIHKNICYNRVRRNSALLFCFARQR